MMIIPILLTFFSPSIRASEGSSVGCRGSLGVSSGDIKDNQMTASSSFSPSSVGAENGRLGTERGGGAWCPASLISEHSEQEWLQVDLGQEMLLSGLISQGRYAGGQGEEYAELISVQVWREEQEEWQEVVSQAPANRDTYSKVEILLEQSVLTSKVRVLPVSKHHRMVCLRIELLGCNPEDLTMTTTESSSSILPDIEDKIVEQELGRGRDKKKQEAIIKQRIVNPGRDDRSPGQLVTVDKDKKVIRDSEVVNRTVESEEVKDENGEIVSLTNSEGQYMMVSVIVLVSIIVILIITIIFILYKNYQFTHSKTIISSDSDLAESSYPLYQARTMDSTHQVYSNSVQSTPYKQQQQSPYNNFNRSNHYYPPTTSGQHPPPSNTSQSHYSNYYATTDLIHWHNRKYQPSPSHARSLLSRPRPGGGPGPVDL